MKIAILHGNPRKNGYTQMITDIVSQGAESAGAHVTHFDLANKDIRPCKGCYHCWTVTPGKCIYNDDAHDIIYELLESDIWLFSSPIYYYNLSGISKVLLERTLPLMKQGFVSTPMGLIRNELRYPEKWENKGIGFICAAAFKGLEVFASVKKQFELLSDAMCMNLCANIMRPEAYLLQFDLAKPKTVKTVETALERAGHELATAGQVSEKTHEKAATPLAIDMEHFRKYSGIYWEHAVALGKDANDLKLVQQKVVGDVRILMSEMARSFDPVAGAKLRAVLQFDFPDRDQHFKFTVTKGECTMEETTSEKCDLRVTVDAALWSKLFIRELNVRDALMKRQIVLEGDKMLFTRLDRYFPPPVS